MLFLPEAAGPHDPLLATMSRTPGSMRRTSSIDTSRPDGFGGELVVVARARDLRTDSESEATVIGEMEIVAHFDGRNRRVLSISSSPEREGLDQLVGLHVGPGFRAQVNKIFPGEQEAGSLFHLLLDDMPGALLVSGYGAQRAGQFERPREQVASDQLPPEPKRVDPAKATLAQDDLCAGWAREGTMMVTIRSTGEIPVALGPPAPVLERDDDPIGWHAMEPLAPHAMRRRRCLDVAVASDSDSERTHRVDCHFRDSHMDPTDGESVVHEYSVTGGIDVDADRVVEITARAHVLPWMECPGAVPSAERLSGLPIAEVRGLVRREFSGTSTCTHLNDTLRSLGDLTYLVDQL
jgi:Protein of unknown function (DUF2889)